MTTNYSYRCQKYILALVVVQTHPRLHLKMGDEKGKGCLDVTHQ